MIKKTMRVELHSRLTCIVQSRWGELRRRDQMEDPRRDALREWKLRIKRWQQVELRFCRRMWQLRWGSGMLRPIWNKFMLQVLLRMLNMPTLGTLRASQTFHKPPTCKNKKMWPSSKTKTSQTKSSSSWSNRKQAETNKKLALQNQQWPKALPKAKEQRVQQNQRTRLYHNLIFKSQSHSKSQKPTRFRLSKIEFKKKKAPDNFIILILRISTNAFSKRSCSKTPNSWKRLSKPHVKILYKAMMWQKNIELKWSTGWSKSALLSSALPEHTSSRVRSSTST